MKYRKSIVFALSAIIIVPVLVDNFVLFYFIRDREISQKQAIIAQQVQQLSSTIDFLVSKIQSDFVILSYREPFRSLPEWNTTANYRDKIRLFADFDPVSILSAYYDKAYLLYPDKDLMVDLKNKYLTKLSSSSAAMEASRTIQNRQESDGPPSALVHEGGGTILIIQALPGRTPETTYWLYIELSKKFFTENLGKIFLMDKSALVILDQKGTVLTQVSRGTDFDPNDTRNRHMVSTISLPKRGWQFKYALDYHAIDQEIFNSILQYSLVAILLLLASSLVSTRVARFITRPIADILDLMGLQNQPDRADEITDIKSNIRLLMTRNAELTRALSTSTTFERDTMLRTMVELGTSPEGVTLTELGIDIPLDPSMVYRIAAGIRRSPVDPVVSLAPPGVLHQELLITGERSFVLILAYHQDHCCQDTDTLDQWLTTAEGVYLGLSPEVRTVDQFPEASRQAGIALDHRGLAGGKPVVHYQHTQQESAGYFYPYDLEAKIVSLVKQLNTLGVQEQLDNFISTVRLSGVSHRAASHVYHHLLDALVRLIKDFDLPWDGLNMTGEESIWNLIDNAVSIREMEILIQGFASTLLERLGTTKDSPTIVLANTVKNYVDSHYSLTILSLDMISEELHYSVSHLSAVFKDTFGETIKDYITGIRLGKAQELLANTDLLIADIGTQVGYQNFGSFVKIFKTYLGETPKNHRLRMRGQ